MKYVKEKVRASVGKDAEGKSIKRVVEVVDCEVCESLAEAVSLYGEVKALDLINTQSATNKKNEARTRATAAPSSKGLRDEAFGRLYATNHDAVVELASLPTAERTTRMSALIDAEVVKIRAENDEARKARLAAIPADDDSDEEDND